MLKSWRLQQNLKSSLLVRRTEVGPFQAANCIADLHVRQGNSHC